MTSCDVIGLPPVTISLVTLYNCFLTVENYTKDTQKFSCGKSYHTVVVRGLRVGCSSYLASAHQLCFIANYFGTWLSTVISQSRLHLPTDFHDSRINVKEKTIATALVELNFWKLISKFFEINWNLFFFNFCFYFWISFIKKKKP